MHWHHVGGSSPVEQTCFGYANTYFHRQTNISIPSEMQHTHSDHESPLRNRDLMLEVSKLTCETKLRNKHTKLMITTTTLRDG